MPLKLVRNNKSLQWIEKSVKTVFPVAMKRIKEGHVVSQEIHTNFYLLVITENLFIENTTCFKPVIKQLAHDFRQGSL